MIKISVVGDIGSGKTYISKLFRAPYFSADDEVTKLYTLWFSNGTFF